MAGLGLTNPTHIALIALVLLLVFGAKRLPEMGRSLGSGLREFKESITGSEPKQLENAGREAEGLVGTARGFNPGREAEGLVGTARDISQ
jgi:sec-independent protein translocase protein TatA